MTGLPIVWIGYQVGKIYRKYCWDIISIMVVIMSTAIIIYFGKWIKSIIPINLIMLLLLVHAVYIGIRCYVKDWREERGYYEYHYSCGEHAYCAGRAAFPFLQYYAPYV